jgi:hypothetical protein
VALKLETVGQERKEKVQTRQRQLRLEPSEHKNNVAVDNYLHPEKGPGDSPNFIYVL